jgi:hypothetical protein
VRKNICQTTFLKCLQALLFLFDDCFEATPAIRPTYV